MYFDNGVLLAGAGAGACVTTGAGAGASVGSTKLFQMLIILECIFRDNNQNDL